MGNDKFEAEKRKAKPRKFKRETVVIADWAKADAKKLLYAISCVTLHGGALRFGYTSDGGAYSVGIYGDGDPYTEYIRPGEDIDQFLMDLADAFE